MTHIDAASAGFILQEPTLALGNLRRRAVVNGKSTYIDSCYVVQVTARGVLLVEHDADLQIFNKVGDIWLPEMQNILWRHREIVAASLTPSQIVIALSGGGVALLNLDDAGRVCFVQCVHYFAERNALLMPASLSDIENSFGQKFLRSRALPSIPLKTLQCTSSSRFGAPTPSECSLSTLQLVYKTWATHTKFPRFLHSHVLSCSIISALGIDRRIQSTIRMLLLVWLMAQWLASALRITN